MPSDFEQQGENEWQRNGKGARAVRQSVALRRGHTTRTETGFTLEIRLETAARTVILQLPRRSAGRNVLGRGDYVFSKSDNADSLLAEIEADFRRSGLPWLARFTTEAEIRRGFRDDSFEPSLPFL